MHATYLEVHERIYYNAYDDMHHLRVGLDGLEGQKKRHHDGHGGISTRCCMYKTNSSIERNTSTHACNLLGGTQKHLLGCI